MTGSTGTHTIVGIPTMSPEERRRLILAPLYGTRDPEVERRLFGVTVHGGASHGGACAAKLRRGTGRREAVAVEEGGLGGYKSFWQNPYFQRFGESGEQRKKRNSK